MTTLDHDYRRHLATVREYLESVGNLQTVGRNAQHRYNNQDHSMLAGLYAARNVTGARHDVWEVNTDTQYHEEVHALAGERLVPTPLRPDDVRSHSAADVVAAVMAPLDPIALGAALGTVAALALFLATLGLASGGDSGARASALLSQYLIGYRAAWPEMWLGVLEAGLGGFVLGSATAWLRNRLLLLYGAMLRRRAKRSDRQRLLDEI